MGTGKAEVKRQIIKWPKRLRTVYWENSVLTFDGEKQFEVPELSSEIMERLAGYTLVGFHVKDYPIRDELLAPFAGHRKHGQLWCEGQCPHRCLLSHLFHYAQTYDICCWMATPTSTAVAFPPCKAAGWIF